MEDFILDFFDTIGEINFDSAIKFLGIILVIFWIVVLYWVWFDASERSSSTFVKICYVLLVGILNIIGLIIYLLIRPSRTIEEIYWGDLERRYLKYETAELGDCPQCGAQLAPGYIYCPNCRYELKVKCSHCGIYVDRGNTYCPNCGSTIADDAEFAPDLVPTMEVMKEQIETSKEKVQEAVKSKRIRYATEVGIAEKFNEFASKIGSIFLVSKNKDEKNVGVNTVNVPSSKEKKRKKRKKKKNR